MMNNGECVKTKLGTCCFGFACGVVKGLFLMLLAWVGYFFGYGMSLVEQMANLYYGYAPSFVGGVVGAVWGLVVGFVFGFVLAWLYNFCLCHCCKK